MRVRVVASAVGAVIAASGAVMIIPFVYSLLASDGNSLAFALPATGALLLGTIVFLLLRTHSTYVSGRDVYLIVVLGWLGVGLVGSAPFVLSGILGPEDAFFESMAGFTTTGASVIEAPEEVAPSLLLWRSLSQWAGGIGIVLLFVAVAPLVGFGSTQLYSAEAADPVPERLTSRIRDTAKILAGVYCALTLGGVIALSIAGMGVFDAVNHAMTTVSTGGFSTRSESIAAFDSTTIELFVVAGMVLSGANFALYFQAARGRLGRALGNVELLTYLALILFGTLLVAAVINGKVGSIPLALRDSLFQTVSLATGTGFVTADWKSWAPLSQGVLLILMGIGACAGSTGGGIKVVRLVLLARNGWQELFRMLHPQAVTLLRFGDRVVPERLRTTLLGFFFIYVATLVVGTLLMAFHGLSLGTAFGSTFSCLSISGTALGPVGDAAFFADMPFSAKMILTFYMLLGRLELFTVLVLLTPEFWRR